MSPHPAFTYDELYQLHLKWVEKVNGPIMFEGKIVLPSKVRVNEMNPLEFKKWIQTLPIEEITVKVEQWGAPENYRSPEDIEFKRVFLDEPPTFE